MTRFAFGAVLLAAAALGFQPATAATSVGVQVNIGSPPPPVIVYRSEPPTVLVSGVYVVDDDECEHDFFRYGMYWYVHDDGHWYRARTWRGPFTAIRKASVPRSILVLPAKHWRHPHGGPPGQVKKHHAAAHSKGRGHGRH